MNPTTIKILAHLTQGKENAQIADILNAERAPGEDPWTKDRIRNVIRNVKKSFKTKTLCQLGYEIGKQLNEETVSVFEYSISQKDNEKLRKLILDNEKTVFNQGHRKGYASGVQKYDEAHNIAVLLQRRVDDLIQDQKRADKSYNHLSMQNARNKQAMSNYQTASGILFIILMLFVVFSFLLN